MIWRRLLAAAAFAGLAASQVTTDCNPLNETCPANPALGTKESFTFNKTQNGQLWETVVGPIEYDPETGAKFTINEQGDSPTLRTKFYFFFGRVEFVLKAASGKGIVSSMMLLSDDLDEIDWEFIGSDNRASSNFFGKGIEDYTFGEYHDMDVAPQDDYHNYTTIWTEEKLEWYIDDALVRSLKKDEAKVNDTDVYPQTPCRMSLGIWAGGDPSLNEWTRKWAGGDTDYDAGPYDMYVKSAYIEDYGEGKEYKWGDNSGSWESIEIVEYVHSVCLWTYILTYSGAIPPLTMPFTTRRSQRNPSTKSSMTSPKPARLLFTLEVRLSRVSSSVLASSTASSSDAGAPPKLAWLCRGLKQSAWR